MNNETTVERQPRERAVPCSRCWGDTWNISAVCDGCADCTSCACSAYRRPGWWRRWQYRRMSRLAELYTQRAAARIRRREL